MKTPKVKNTPLIDRSQYIDPITGVTYTREMWRKAPEWEKNHVRRHERIFRESNKDVHIPVRHLEVSFQGHLVKVSLKGGVPKAAPAKRGNITGFSDQSRARLMEKFARFYRPAHTTFITLTYPAEFPSPDAAKDNLRAFLERLRRREDCEKSSGIWRIELQDRGAPHFHILFFDLPWIAKEEIQKMWGEIIGHDKPFTRIEAVRSWNGIMNYCSKYIAKKQEDHRNGSNGFIYLSYLHGLGRVWGVFQKHNLPFARLKIVHWPFIAKAFTRFRAIAEFFWPQLADQEAPGFKLFVKNAYSFIPLWDDCAEILF